MAAAESRPKDGCCNRRLSGLLGDVGKIYFQTQSHRKHEYLHSKQQPTIDKSAEAQHAERVPLSNKTSDPNRSLVKCNIVTDYRTRSSGTRTAAAAESKPKGGCCNWRLSELMGDVAKISFQTQSHSKHEYLHSKQQPTIDKSAEAQHAERVPLSAQKKSDCQMQSLVPHRARLSNFHRGLLEDCRVHRVAKRFLSRKSSISYKKRLTLRYKPTIF